MEAVGSSTGVTSPLTLKDFEKMKQAAAFGDEDIRYLRMSRDVLKDQVESILDTWYGFFGSLPQLLATFSSKTDGRPIETYLGAVRERFGAWILETAEADYDQAWLDKQHLIGLRHHRAKKNQTDHVASMDIVPFRYLFPTVFPVTSTLKPFLAKKGHKPAEVEKMHAAWVKSVLLQLTLWSQPYIPPSDY